MPFAAQRSGGRALRAAAGRRRVFQVRAIVEMSRAVGKETVAQFVGCTATLEELRRCGVDYVQGHHIGKPVDLGQVCPDAALEGTLLASPADG
ncbi:MAG: EAL domain-containing protein [Acidobacteriota bacterium]